MRRLKISLACIVTMAALSSGACLAQNPGEVFPVKPVTLVVPFAAGTTITDIESRLYAQKLSEGFGGRPVLLDFRAGAGGMIGALFVAKSVPDGYTVLGASGATIIAPLMQKNPLYDPARDFTPLAQMTTRTNLLVVHPSLPARSVAEYIAYARANPGKVNFSTPGTGSGPHLGGAWLHRATDTTVTFISYKGTAPAMTDLVSGRIQASIGSYSSMAPQVSAGKLRLIGVTGEERLDLVPDIPTIAEQGVPGYNYSNWFGIVGPAGMPRPVVIRLNAELNRISSNPEVVKKMAAENSKSVSGSTPEQFRALIATETSRWQQVIRDAGITPE